MSIFIWNGSFSVGVDHIDRQHQKLAGLINQLSDSLTIDGNSKKVISVLDELIAYTHYHFIDEEEFMINHNYDADSFKVHRSNHISFLKTIWQKQVECHSDPEQVTEELLDFLVSWMTHHILGEDKEMAKSVLNDKSKPVEGCSNIDILENNLYGALKESESRFKELADSMPAYIWISNEKGERIFYNQQWRILTGMSCAQLQQSWMGIIVTEDRRRVQQLYSANGSDPKKLEMDYRVIDKDRSQHWLLETVVTRRMTNGDLAGFMGCAIDITRQKTIEENLENAVQSRTQALQASNQKLAEEKQEQMELNRRLADAQGQLVQSEKMASIGLLAAGVAHEINNPLGYIHSNLHTLQQYLSALDKVLDFTERLTSLSSLDSVAMIEYEQLKKNLDLDFIRQDLYDLVKESIEGASRARQIVQDLRNFSHISSQKKEMFDIEKGLDATLNIVYNELKYKAKVHKEYAGLPLYECVGSQLNQVFMNLLVNAAHAIEGFGAITLRTGYQNNDRLWVEVEDSGKGMPENIKNKIFDPFFTTKPVGEGTGLGLSLAYQIIQDHQGEIELDSEVGKGTRFRIYFPLAVNKKVCDG